MRSCTLLVTVSTETYKGHFPSKIRTINNEKERKSIEVTFFFLLFNCSKLFLCILQHSCVLSRFCSQDPDFTLETMWQPITSTKVFTLYKQTFFIIIIVLMNNFFITMNCNNELCNYIYIYSFSRHFYPKRLTIEEYNKRYIIKRKTDT